MNLLERIARNLVREDYYRNHHQPSGAVEGYVDNEWPGRVDDARAAVAAILDGISESDEAELLRQKYDQPGHPPPDRIVELLNEALEQ